MRMPCLLAVFLTFSVVVDRVETFQTSLTDLSAQCHDWDMKQVKVVRVYQGELGRLGCPILHNLEVTNRSLFWYRVQPDDVLWQPINVSLPGHRISAESQWLWLQPAIFVDSGMYACTVSRNGTQCGKMTVWLEVLPKPSSGCVAAVDPLRVKIPLEEDRKLHCPDVQDFQLSHRLLSVAWFHKCSRITARNPDREVLENTLAIYSMLEAYQGNYTCVATFQHGRGTLNFTRVITVLAMSSSRWDKRPIIHNPDERHVYSVKLGSVVRLDCRAMLYGVEGNPELWWEIDGRSLAQTSDHRITNKTSYKEDSLGDRTVTIELIIQEFSSQDLGREYTCNARNIWGSAARRAALQLEAYIPSLELGCGLGVVFLSVLILFVVYRVFRLELLLLYRAYCSPDKSVMDGKEYDVYISYARHSEDEQFVLMTLRRVLESELGYKVFIFDRDSLPGGTITDETLSYVGRSRCLMVVLSPRYVVQGTQALLELKAGLDTMAQAGDLRVILVQYQPVARASWVRELRRARVALALVRWKGEKSADLSSRFWKQLQLQLPMRKRKPGLPEDGSTLPLTKLTL
ncbi:hypothetical protein GJAV_G00056270 [Gymnothorax javanicus]|nr:hypothetical protein GJAV_G00056270 [Gymnothorax javanicus]